LGKGDDLFKGGTEKNDTKKSQRKEDAFQKLAMTNGDSGTDKNNGGGEERTGSHLLLARKNAVRPEK